MNQVPPRSSTPQASSRPASGAGPHPGSGPEQSLIIKPKLTLKGYLDQIRDMPSVGKMGQIGIEKHVLGIPAENPTFEKQGSLFDDHSTQALDGMPTPKHWQEFYNLQKPEDIVNIVPDTTLFFMFYGQPRDQMQRLAAIQLKHRGWDYNAEAGVWFRLERGKMIHFDVKRWNIMETRQAY